MNLHNVKIKNPIYTISENEKIRIDLDAIEKSAVFNKTCEYTPEGILFFCRSFKEANSHKENRGEYYQKAPGCTLGLHTLFEEEAPKCYEYALLAHILLAQARIRSKIVSTYSDEDSNGHAFVVYMQNGKIQILDAALQSEIVEPDAQGVYKHYSKKRAKDMLYNQNITNEIFVSPLEDVADYAPQN
ncbi:MAG: hypothetical protein RSC04_02235 [Bacteroidales bacterium]